MAYTGVVVSILLVISMSDLGPGDKNPIFSLPDENNEIVDIRDFIGAYPLVIYFYPKDDTPGCTKEACGFRDQYEDFQRLGAKIFGISSDRPGSHKKFKEKHNLPFTLLSDENREVEKQFGVPRNFLGLLPGRVTYIIDKEGIIRHVFNSQLQPVKHVGEAKRILEGLQ